MSKKYTSKDSQTDWQRITTMQDNDIDLSDIPGVTQAQMARAKMRSSGKPVAKGKVRVNIFLDAEVVAYFKPKAGTIFLQIILSKSKI